MLVVDDYTHNRDLHKLLLQKEGVSVILASNGNEAFNKYKGQPDGFFDFIMMDVMMPEVDGFEAVKMIRKWEIQERRQKVDIYFVSGEYYNEEEVIAAFMLVGGERDAVKIQCLRKPIDIQVIRGIVERYKNQGSRN